MNILYISGIHGGKYAGPSYSVPQSIKSISHNNRVVWINVNPKYSEVPNYSNVRFYNSTDFKNLGIKTILNDNDKLEIAVFEEIYHIEFCSIARELRKNNIPYIVIPRGGLCKEAQSTKRIKKIAGNILFFSSFLRKASAIQYLTEKEYIDSGDKWNKRYIIIPNGIELPNLSDKSFSSDFLVGSFIGRLDIKHKGLDLLISAVAIEKELLLRNNIRIHLYGADSVGDLDRIKELLRTHCVDEIITIHEPVYDQEKVDVLINSDFFVLTSRYEGHPMGLIEACAYGLPSLVTYGSNMGNEINDYKAGWACENDVNSICNGLKKLIDEKDSFNLISVQSRKLAECYSWDTISIQTIKCFELIIDRYGKR